MKSVSYLMVAKSLGPHLLLVVGALVALTADLAFFRQKELAVRRRGVGVITLVALVLGMLALIRQYGWWHPVNLLNGTLVVDQLTVVFAMVIVALTAVTVVISMEHEIGRHVGEYYATMLFAAVGMMVLVTTEDLITIFVALELLSLCLYILTAFHKNWLRSQEAALKYFMFGAVASAFLLFGLSYLYGVTGATNLRAMPAVLTGMNPLVGTGLLFVLVGFGFKVAVVPFHLWAPDAYEGAPTPVTAYIATGSKVASFFVLLKLLFVGLVGAQGTAFWGHFSSGWVMLLAVMATLSMVLGNFVAIVQRNIKRLLAYSSIAHGGYILIGLIAATKMGAAAVLFYVIVYAITNLGAFGVVAALAGKAGGDDVAHFNGMARRAPFLSLLMLIFMLSLAGIPPLGGFFGKFYLFAAAVERDSQNFGLLWLVIVGILTSAVSLYYYLIVLKHIYVHAPAQEDRIATPPSLTFCLGLLALAVVALGVFPQPILTLLSNLLARL